MKVCFPVKEILQLDSKVYGHFGSAPAFVLVDAETGSLTVLPNANQHHAHGMCNPVAALSGQTVDAVVVGGIGGGALMKLNMAGITVYKAMAETIANISTHNAYHTGQIVYVRKPILPIFTCCTPVCTCFSP